MGANRDRGLSASRLGWLRLAFGGKAVAGVGDGRFGGRVGRGEEVGTKKPRIGD